jgi:SAM-dependent methyltransferase
MRRPWRWGSSELAGPHNWLIHAIVEPAVASRIRRHARGRLLDIGCGTKPYRAYCEHLDAHVGVDLCTRSSDSRADMLATAYELPFAPATFDTILCTYVLEHLEDPLRAVEEARRVLKPGGMAIYTAPLFWHIHEAPRDFYRFTRFGLTHLFESGGLEVVEIEGLTGFTAMAGQELVYFLYQLRNRRALRPLRWAVPPVAHVIQASALLANRFERTEAFTADYLAVVRKPRQGDGEEPSS